MKEIDGKAKSIRDLLGGTKFAIDYYQREYRWATKQVTELIDDLAGKFLESHEAGNDPSAVEYYGHYFLGSIIISDKDGKKFIIDGQQRLTSLTLLLIHLHRQLEDDEQKSQLADLIFSLKHRKRSFNLDVPERTACMEALFTKEPFEENDQPESVVNILNRFQDIEDNFPEDLLNETLPFFADWLIENVHLVIITAYSDSDAYTIFETMNDRGLSLTPTDMLKGYLLANIKNVDSRNEASRIWRTHVTDLQQLGKEEDADAIKAWLRSQHAKTIRERKRGAIARDFDLIGTEFHRWVRDHQDLLNLSNSSSFGRFIQEDFAFYGGWYERIRKAAISLTPGLEAIHYNAQHNFTLQYPALLAPLVRSDNDTEIFKKIRIVSSFIDILIARRIWNLKSTGYSTMQYYMFQLIILKIRGKSTPELAKILYDLLNDDDEFWFEDNDRFSLHGMNKKLIHRLLARITDYIETGSGQASRYSEYIQRGGKNQYEVEHIWANHPERHEDEFDHPNDFADYRNRIGGLLLLPKSFNASYGDLNYEKKLPEYFSQNLLARSLNPNCYDHNPGFLRFLKESGLPFQAHADFRKADLDARQELYRQIAEQIWNPKILLQEAEK